MEFGNFSNFVRLDIFLRGVKRGVRFLHKWGRKLRFIGLFAQQEDNTHLNARVLPHPLRGRSPCGSVTTRLCPPQAAIHYRVAASLPLKEGASYLNPRKFVTR